MSPGGAQPRPVRGEDAEPILLLVTMDAAHVLLGPCCPADTGALPSLITNATASRP